MKALETAKSQEVYITEVAGWLRGFEDNAPYLFVSKDGGWAGAGEDKAMLHFEPNKPQKRKTRFNLATRRLEPKP